MFPNDHTPGLHGHIFNVFEASASADTWVTTPGGTGVANDFSQSPAFVPSLVDGETVTHFDTTNDGAQSGFRFAQITLVPDVPGGRASATLDLSFQSAADPMPVFDDVSVTMVIVPEPDMTWSVLLFAFALVRLRKSRNVIC